MSDGASAAWKQTKANDRQVGGDHYKRFGDTQPWDILKLYLTEEQFKGYLLGTAIDYLLRANHKGSFNIDVLKGHHTTEKLIEEMACNGK